MLHEIEEADLRDRIEQVVEEYPRYGYRRVTHHLRREGFKVNHKRVSRIMREESLQCQVKRHWVKTTDSDHPYRVYPNLLKGLRATRPNQAWGGRYHLHPDPHGVFVLGGDLGSVLT